MDRRDLAKQRRRLETAIILATLIGCFIFASFSISQRALATSPIPTPPSNSNMSSTPTLKPTGTDSVIESLNMSTFGYTSIGKECSDMPASKTITLCNYTTPPYPGKIVQISIYLTGVAEGSRVRAVIFADDDFPQGGEPISQSLKTVNVTSATGEWYNFTMNCPASKNTVYWLGYYSDNVTHYFFDANNNSISVTSQPKDGKSDWLPVGWSYRGKSIMSLYALYTLANETQSSSTQAHFDSTTHESTFSWWDVLFVLLVIGAESAVVVTHRTREKRVLVI
jgi:hypothetical protein